MTVARVLNENAPESEPLPWPSTDKEPERQAEGYLGEDLQPGQTRTSRYAGALMLFAALGQLDLWGVLHRLGAQVGPSRWFGMMPTIAAIVFCFALRFRSIEDFKNVGRQDFGVLLGTRQGPSVQTLRLKLQQITESLEPVLLNRELLKRYLELEPVWEGMYYVDGHFCPYYGHYSTPKGWNPHRRLAAPGYTDIYIHDIHGRALFFVSQPLNDSLVRAMPGVVEEIRRVHGANPFTVVFDRGGYSGELFRWLTEENIGFISYLKGRKARRRYPEGRFEKSWYEFEKVRQVYRVYEKKTQINKAGLIRTEMTAESKSPY
jgi:hypothetical protein